jgi:hypothetical protein
MSTGLFSYNFFQDGKQDTLAEVRILQYYGQWTEAKRTRWTKEAVSTHHHLKHTHPATPQGAAYYAGRVAALRSRRTAHFPSAPKPQLEYQTGWAWCGDEDNEGITHSTVHPGDLCLLCGFSNEEARERPQALARIIQSDLERARNLLFTTLFCLVALPFLMGVLLAHVTLLLVAFLMNDDKSERRVSHGKQRPIL